MDLSEFHADADHEHPYAQAARDLQIDTERIISIFDEGRVSKVEVDDITCFLGRPRQMTTAMGQVGARWNAAMGNVEADDALHYYIGNGRIEALWIAERNGRVYRVTGMVQLPPVLCIVSQEG
jgi:hypothetical protein